MNSFYQILNFYNFSQGFAVRFFLPIAQENVSFLSLFLFVLETAEFNGFDQINAYKKHIVDFSERKKSWLVISDLSHELTFLADSFKGDERLFQNYREKSKVKLGL